MDQGGGAGEAAVCGAAAGLGTGKGGLAPVAHVCAVRGRHRAGTAPAEATELLGLRGGRAAAAAAEGRAGLAAGRAAAEARGVREEDLKGAPTFPEIWGPLSRLLEACDSIWAYHAAFDRLALEASARRWRLELPGWLTAREKWHCLMELYAEWMGLEYWVPLERACRQEGIAAGWHPHTAELDAQAALALLRVLAGLEKA